MNLIRVIIKGGGSWLFCCSLLPPVLLLQRATAAGLFLSDLQTHHPQVFSGGVPVRTLEAAVAEQGEGPPGRPPPEISKPLAAITVTEGNLASEAGLLNT